MPTRERPHAVTDRPRLLAVGDAAVPTGFARVLHNILDRLRDRYDIHHFGLNYEYGRHDTPWPVYTAFAEGDEYGMSKLGPLIEELKPDLVFFLYDVDVLGRFASVMARYRGQFPTVIYFPVDVAPIDASLVPALNVFDRWVAFNRFGADSMQAALREAGAPPREIETIPHGTDIATFHPLPGGRVEAKRKLFSDHPRLADSFIVLNANRNQPRKRIDTTIEGFAIFAADKPANVRLYLHMGRVDAGWDVMRLAKRHGIDKRLILTNADARFRGVSTDQLNLIYNACDVGINTATGEGWGLVSFEHAATGAAQIVPRHTSCAELWDGAAEFVEPVLTLTQKVTLSRISYVSPQGVAGALERVYADPERRRDLAAAAYRNATQQAYHWDVIVERWDVLFQDQLAAHRARAGA